MMLVGYARTSTVEQVAGLEVQRRELKAAGAEKIFVEQVSSVARREQLTAALDFVRNGDTLCVHRLDRLARSTADLLGMLATLEGKQVGLRVLDFGGSEIDTKSPSGRLIVTVMGAIAELERSLMLQRQLEGIARAKSEGKYKGRSPTARAKAALVRELKLRGFGATAIASEAGISRASVYRLLSEGEPVALIYPSTAKTSACGMTKALEGSHP